jgi:hypothetical protein
MTIPTWDDFGASLVLHANLSIAHLIFGVDNEATIPGLANESAKVFAHVTHVSTSYIYIYLGKLYKYIYIHTYIYRFDYMFIGAPAPFFAAMPL